MTVTSAAPRARAAWAATRPTGPAPVTSTREPAVTPPLRHAHRPTESGSSSAAASSLSESGTGWANSSCEVTSSAKAPSYGGVAKNRIPSQRLYRPARHWAQEKSGTPGSSETRCPTDSRVTAAPTPTTTPEGSCPSTSGESTV